MAILPVSPLNFGTRTGGATPKFAGVDATTALIAAEVGGDSFPNDGKTFFRIKNGGSAITVTVQAVKASDQGLLESPVFDVGATTGEKWLGPFPAAEFNDVNGRVIVNYSAITTVTVRPYSLGERGRG